VLGSRHPRHPRRSAQIQIRIQTQCWHPSPRAGAPGLPLFPPPLLPPPRFALDPCRRKPFGQAAGKGGAQGSGRGLEKRAWAAWRVNLRR